MLMPYIDINEMPDFPLEDWQYNTSARERQLIAGAYLAKMVEKAQNGGG